MRRAASVAYWGAPPLLMLALYWPGLTAWFQKDDFAWLGLRGLVHSRRDLAWALFAPLAQGTIRTLSERVFFLSFYSLFGLDALPYRIWVFATAFATLAMLSIVASKLTGSRAVGFWAAVLWTVNGAIAFVMSWTAIYYELACTLVLLVSFRLLLGYIETGRRGWYIAQWATFLLGFGVLELNVVYPALALAYVACCARRFIGKVLPLFIPSLLYIAIHTAAAPLPRAGVYKLYWDASIVATFWTYLKMALGPNRLIVLRIYPSPLRSVLTILLMAGLLCFVIRRVRRREWLVLFFPAWFVIALAPLLPLRDKIEDSYLTIPVVGLAMLGAWAVVSGWHAGTAGRIAAVALVTVYLCVAIPVARVNAQSFHDRSYAIRTLLTSIVREEPRAERSIVLKGVDFDMFWSAFFHRPLRLYGMDEVYLLKEDEARIAPGVQPDYVDRFFVDEEQVRAEVAQGRADVMDVSGGTAQDITDSYRRPR